MDETSIDPYRHISCRGGVRLRHAKLALMMLCRQSAGLAMYREANRNLSAECGSRMIDAEDDTRRFNLSSCRRSADSTERRMRSPSRLYGAGSNEMMTTSSASILQIFSRCLTIHNPEEKEAEAPRAADQAGGWLTIQGSLLSL